jgi:competence protein ComEC
MNDGRAVRFSRRAHFLNVKQGDCSIIEHNSDRVTVIDVCNAKADTVQERLAEAVDTFLSKSAVLKNFNQKAYPTNPITYLKDRNISSVFRFILTHPDMDHLDGIKAFWEALSPINFWDTDNTCFKNDDDFKNGSPFNYDDWAFYEKLRAGNGPSGLTRLTLSSGKSGQYWNRGENGSTSGSDGLHILAPTPESISQANDCQDFNDCSYVLLYRLGAFRILFGGDSHDQTWEHIIDTHAAELKGIDLLIAPHHGRKSGRSYDFLDLLQPRMTFFGNASSEHLAYGAWNNRGLPFVTNNQAGNMVVSPTDSSLDLYVTNETFARKKNTYTFYSEGLRAWYVQEICQYASAAA